MKDMFFVISEIILECGFPTAQFHINNYEVYNCPSLWKIAFVKGKRLINFELKVNKFMCPDFTISNPKWVCFSVYKILKRNDLQISSQSLQKPLVKLLNFTKTSFQVLKVIKLGEIIRSFWFIKFDNIWNFYN